MINNTIYFEISGFISIVIFALILGIMIGMVLSSLI